jgi:hypothetical protein
MARYSCSRGGWILIGFLWTGSLWAEGTAPDSEFCRQLARVASAAVNARAAGLSLAQLNALISDQQTGAMRSAIWTTTLRSYDMASPEAAAAAALARCRATEARVAEDWRRRDQGLPPLGPLAPEDAGGQE